MSVPRRADVVVVGGGHNGLSCAAFLARAGREVVVLEARDELGGCASTVDAIGARVNICNCDHTMVLASGIVDELDLGAHGLRYLDVDPVSVAVGWDDVPAFVQWRDVERTVAGLARVDPAAAVAYRRYLAVALPAARTMLTMQRARPTVPRLAAAAASARFRGTPRLVQWARRSVLDVLGSFDLPPWLVAAVATSGPGVWGLAPDVAGTGLAALGPAVRHLAGVGRPVGGSGSLTTALAAAARAHGAVTVCRTRVAGVQVRDGKVIGVRTEHGEVVEAGTVVAAADPRTVVVDWLDGVPEAAALRATYAAQQPGDGYESKLDAVVTRLPRLRALAELPDDVLPAASHGVATTLVNPTPQQQIAAVAQRAAGRVSDPPMFFVNTPSVLDASMRPTPDTHLLSLEVLWTPYDLATGWVGSDEPDRWLSRLSSICVEDVAASVVDRRTMTPVDYERDFSMARGYAPSFPGGVVGALLGRHPELSRYRTPVGGLFLTGAGTFPGAGVWGASGRNTAATILDAA